MLKAMNLGYDEREDRLVLRVISDDETGEQVLHLTRRVCATWRIDLQALIDRSAAVPASLSRTVQASVSSAHHQAMAAQATIRKEPAVPPQALPAPQLVLGVRCGHRRSDGRWIMQFQTAAGRELTLQLSAESMHGLVKVVQAQLNAACWDLPALPFDARPTQTAPEGALH